MIQRKITLNEHWLHLPIGRDAKRWYVRFEVDGQQFAEFHLGLAMEQPDFYCGMDLTKYAGREITITAEANAPEMILEGIIEGGAMDQTNPLYPDLYQESLRPQVHFSSRRGWLNDPNGLFYDGEHYHLYYQHNPYGIEHGNVNIHWGHAVSTDCIHWEEHSDALAPWVSRCHIASGSCMIDRDGIAGYGRNAVIAAFTHLGSRNYRIGPDVEYPSDGQFLAYSVDGGETFTLFPDNPVIPTQNGNSWRDPRIFAYPGGGFGIAVYETTERGNCVSFYHSADLHHWIQTSQADDLFECPDLFCLTPINDHKPRWVLYGADGMYRIGDFVDGVFHQEGESLPLDYGPSTYAGQTWNDRDDGDGRLHISWLRGQYPDMPFSQCMTVPCLLTLVKTPDGYRLNRNPVPALETLRAGKTIPYNLEDTKEALIDLLLPGDTVLEIRAEGPVNVQLGEAGFRYDPQTGHVAFQDGRDLFLQDKGDLCLRMLTDVTSCEFFLQEEISATYGIIMADKALRIFSDEAFAVSGTSYSLKSIW